MINRHSLQPVALSDHSHLHTLVENKTAYTLNACELNVFETHAASYLVPLTFNDFVVTSMLRGKKVMHLLDKDSFDYLPGESVIVPANTTMRIDFPDADMENPTQCTALAIDGGHIKKTVHYLNENFPRQFGQSWQLDYNQYHFYNNEDIAMLINKLIAVCMSSSAGKDVLADLAVKELLFRIMQVQNLSQGHKPDATEHGSNPLTYVIAYIRQHISDTISIEDLSSKAYMSKSTFYRAFKRELGLSPIEFVLQEKINTAKRLLLSSPSKIGAISAEIGFQDVNYFIRLFKKMEGVTPKQYRLNALKH